MPDSRQERPCHCDKVPALSQAYDHTRHCRLCTMYYRDERYRAMWLSEAILYGTVLALSGKSHTYFTLDQDAADKDRWRSAEGGPEVQLLRRGDGWTLRVGERDYFPRVVEAAPVLLLDFDAVELAGTEGQRCVIVCQ